MKKSKKNISLKKKDLQDKKPKSFIKIMLILFMIFAIPFSSIILYIYIKLPNIDKNFETRINNNKKIYLLYSNNLENIKSYNVVNKDDISYNELSPNLINALLATEDRRFFEHHGVDFISILRATIVNIKQKKFAQGGSTISQQLAKAILKDNSKNLRRKLKELILTLRLEYIFSKEEILTMYLNLNYFGGGKIGIKNASEFYFGKLPSDLTIEESAVLIGLLKAPGRFAPTVSQEMATRRALQVIINMQNAGYLTPKDVFSYVIPEIQYSYNEINRKSQKYYFTDYVRKKIYYYEAMENNQNINEFSIITTMNSEIQNTVEETLFKFLDTNRKKIDDTQIAIVVLNNKGEVLAMVGGKNYDQSAFNRAIYAYRQTGSLFKLFVYTNALERGLKTTDVFVDEPVSVKDWYPENYGNKYYGNVDIKTSFAKSLNSVAIQIADYFGLDNLINLAKKMGITSEFKKNDLTVTLGTTNINLLEMTKAFAIINNNGYNVNVHSVKTIYKNQTYILYEYIQKQREKLLNFYTVINMKSLLYEVIKNGTGQNAQIESLIAKTENYNNNNEDKQYFIGGKTGSSQDNRDAWFIGYANDLTIGIWMGNDDNSPTNNILGGTLPAILWKEIVNKLIK